MRDPLKDVLGLGSNVLDFLKEAGRKVVAGLSSGAQKAAQTIQQAPARLSASAPQIRDLIASSAKSAVLNMPQIAGARALIKAAPAVSNYLKLDQPTFATNIKTGVKPIDYLFRTQVDPTVRGARALIEAASIPSYAIGGMLKASREQLQGNYRAPDTSLDFRVTPVAGADKGKPKNLDFGELLHPGLVGIVRGVKNKQPLMEEAPKTLGVDPNSLAGIGIGLAAEIASPDPFDVVRAVKAGEKVLPKGLKAFSKLAEEAQSAKTLEKFIAKVPQNAEEILTKAGFKGGVEEFFAKATQKLETKAPTEVETLIAKAKAPVKTITEGFTPIKDIMAKKPEEIVASAQDLLNKTPDEIVAAVKAKVKPRKFLQSVQESPATGEKLAEAVGEVSPQTYVQITNKQALAQADEILKTQGIDVAKAQVLDFKTPVNEVKTALGIRIAEKAEVEGRLDEAVEVVENLDRQLREAGRFIQAASLWDRLSPDAMVRAAERAAQKVGTNIPTDVKSEIIQKVMDVRKLPEAERQNAMLGVLNFVAEKLPPTKGELFDAYRYQNMLSGLKTHERNIYQNLFSTLITRPLDLLGASAVDFVKHPFNPAARDFALADVPRYYKNVFSHTTDALSAAKEAMKMMPDSTKIEGLVSDTAIQAIRRANMAKHPIGKYVSVVPRFLTAQDNFFSVLIGAGEQARLMAKGLDEGAALGKAKELAEKYLLRETLGTADEQATMVKALDSLGQFFLKGRSLPVVGKPYSWFVPFITTPINAAKMMVEHSPLGLITNKGLKPGIATDTEALGKAAVGSVVTAWGAMLASQDRVTWDAPTDPQAKELFYASGRKPFSVKIGDTWTPMWYFGAFALPLAIPAASKYYSEESRTAPTDDGFQKLVNIAGGLSKFITSQTPMQGVSGFFRMLDGDIDVSLASLAGFTAGQVIPLSSLVAYVNTIIDPIYRKGKGFGGAIARSIPFGTLNQPAYTTPTGEESRRLPVNYLLPYDVGQAEAGYEQPFQARQEQLQSNAILNDLTKSIESGTGGGGIFGFGGGKTPEAGITDISALEGTELATALKKKESFKKVNDYMALYYKTNDEKVRGQIEQTVSKYGLSFQDANYNYIASLDGNSKVTYLENQLDAGTLDHDSLITVLREGRKESLSDEQFATNAVIDDLYDLDYITDAERKALKKLRINVNGEVISGGGASGVSRGKSGAGKKVDTAIAKIITDAQNEIIQMLGNPPKLGSVEALSKETAAPAQKGVKIPSIQADVAIKPRQVLTSGDVQAMIARARGQAATSGTEEAKRIIASLRGGGSTGATPTKLSSSFFRSA